jgi:hypothetical protein
MISGGRACVCVRFVCLIACCLCLCLCLCLGGEEIIYVRARPAGAGGQRAAPTRPPSPRPRRFRFVLRLRRAQAPRSRRAPGTRPLRCERGGRAGPGVACALRGERGTCTRRVTRSTGSRHRAITHSTVHRARTRATAGDDARARWPADSSLVQVAVHHWLCAARHAETLPSSSSEKTTSIDRSIGLLRPSEL